MSIKTERIRILILSTENEDRLLEEIANANDSAGNETQITAEVIRPFDIMLQIRKTDYSLRAFRRFHVDAAFNTSLDLVDQFDAIISKLGKDREGLFGQNIIRHFQLMNVYSTAPAYALENCTNQFKVCQLLVKDKTLRIPVKTQLLMNGPAALIKTLEFVGGLPVNGKITKGTEQIAEIVMNDNESGITALQSVNNSDAEILISANIKTSDFGIERIKAIVINSGRKNTKVFAYKIKTYVFTDQNSLSGLLDPVILTDSEVSFSKRAALVLGLDLAEVTIIRDSLHQNDSYITDISGNPDILRAEQALPEVNVSAEIVNSVIEAIRENRGKYNVENVMSHEYAGRSSSEGKFLPSDFMMNLNRAQKHIRLAALNDRRRLSLSEIEAIKIIDDLMNQIK